MSEYFDLRRRIYDLYSFDAPYDLEPTGLSDFLRGYEKELDSHKGSTPVDTEDEEDEFRHLDLTFEEVKPDCHLLTSGFRLVPDQDKASGERPRSSPALGATLSQRKKLLKERIEELIADIRKREKLEEETLEKADVESTGLEFLLGQVRTWSLGNYPSVDMRRTNLEREILALKKAGWDERLRCWRDLVMLKKELREALEEYHLILSVEGL
jgi:hypothetical protein